MSDCGGMQIFLPKGLSWSVERQRFKQDSCTMCGYSLLRYKLPIKAGTTKRITQKQEHFTSARCHFNKTHWVSNLNSHSIIPSPSFRAWPLLWAIPPERKLHNHWPAVRSWSCGSVHMWPWTLSRTRPSCHRVHQCEGSVLEWHRAFVQR